MNILTLDFETFYSTEFSLSNMTTVEYICDPRFEVIGVAVKVNDDPVQSFTGTKEATAQWLAQFDWGNSAAIIHNAMFDASILDRHFNIHPKLVLCTQALARISGLAVLAKGTSLAKLTKYLGDAGYSILPKGTEVENMKGKRRTDFTPEAMERAMQYCRNDVTSTKQLFDALVGQIPASEFPWVGLIVNAYTKNRAFVLDAPMLAAELERIESREVEILESLSARFGLADIDMLKKQLISNPKFAEFLGRLGGVTEDNTEGGAFIIPQKVSKTTGKTTYAFAKTDPAMQKLAEHENDDVSALVSARLGVKGSIARTRTQLLLNLAKFGRIGMPYNISGAHTGRLSGADKLNVQNFPSGRVKGQTKVLRQALMAPPGHVVVGADSAQVEARVLAYASGAKRLLDLFLSGDCPYSDMAIHIFGVKDATPKQVKQWAKDGVEDYGTLRRPLGKEAVLGCGYGMGAERFFESCASKGVVISKELALMAVQTYRTTHVEVPAFWRTCDQVLRSMMEGRSGAFGGPNGDLFYYDGARVIFGQRVPGIRLPDGYWLNYFNLRQEDTEERGKTLLFDQLDGGRHTRTFIYGAKLVENLIQALAFALLKWQALQMSAITPLQMNVHDEHVIIVPESAADNAVKWVEKCMSDTPPWLAGCPIACEVGVAPRYGDC